MCVVVTMCRVVASVCRYDENCTAFYKHGDGGGVILGVNTLNIFGSTCTVPCIMGGVCCGFPSEGHCCTLPKLYRSDARSLLRSTSTKSFVRIEPQA